jgi:hypothetical protein
MLGPCVSFAPEDAMPLYLLNLPEPDQARGADPALSFSSDSADGFAAELQAALRGDGLFQRWKAGQPDPDAVSDALAATDPQATVTGSQAHLKIHLRADTSLPGDVLKHRLRLLAGSNWSLSDVR